MTPFTINGHLPVGRKTFDRLKRKPEVVSDLGEVLICRSVEPPMSLSKASLPSGEFLQQIEAVFDPPLSHVDTLDRDGKLLLLEKVAERALACLAVKARTGNGEALYRFARLTVQASEALSQMAEKDPAALEPVAGNYVRWPLMKSRHPKNSDPETLLDNLNLSASLPLTVDKYSKWKPGVAASVAFDIFKHLNSLRDEEIKVEYRDGEVQAIRDALPPFSRSSAERWWRFAKQELLSSYPKPQDVPELASLATKSDRRSPGRWKQSILDKIKARFIAIAQIT